MDQKKYYVICPSSVVTGGPDALHQMVYYLRKCGKDAEIAYVPFDSCDASIPERYRLYVQTYTLLCNVEDGEDVVIICSEMQTYYTKRFKKAKVYIWWLSVDNNFFNTNFNKKFRYIVSLPFLFLRNPIKFIKFGKASIINRLLKKPYNFKKERDNVSHICASYYAFDYVGTRSTHNVDQCIEPISLEFLNGYSKESECSYKKENIVLYNPKKSGEEIKKLSLFDDTIEFVPLKGLDVEGLIEVYKRAKLFIDFGPFPGAERMPKEAVLYGCAVITGKRGASAFYGDVPIPDEYKFNSVEEQKKQICEKIHYCLENYPNIIGEFENYKNTVLNLESNFINSINRVFNK